VILDGHQELRVPEVLRCGSSLSMSRTSVLEHCQSSENFEVQTSRTTVLDGIQKLKVFDEPKTNLDSSRIFNP